MWRQRPRERLLIPLGQSIDLLNTMQEAALLHGDTVRLALFETQEPKLNTHTTPELPDVEDVLFSLLNMLSEAPVGAALEDRDLKPPAPGQVKNGSRDEIEEYPLGMEHPPIWTRPGDDEGWRS